jgi:hypothetical protein
MPLVTITSPGPHHITADYTAGANDHGVVIAPNVHNVRIYLYSRLVGAGGPSSVNSGIYYNGNADVAVIGMGGSIRGFQYGVRGENTNLARVRNVFVQDAYFRGIVISGQEPIIEDNDIRNIGGCTVFPNAYCMGIETQGTTGNGGRAKVLRNSVEEVYGVGSGESVGISLSDKSQGSVVHGNIIRNRQMRAGSFGLWVGGESDPSVAGNHFERFAYGAAFSSVPTGFLDENSFRDCGQKVLHQSNGKVTFGTGDLLDA